MKILIKDVSELTSTEYKACYQANYGVEGYMREQLVLCRDQSPAKSHYTGKVIMLWEGPDNKTSSMLAWALLTPTRTYGTVAASRWIKSKSIYTAEFWVKRQHRGKGYGKILMAEVKKFDPRPHVFPHDEPSAEFFAGYHITASQVERREWMVGKRKTKIS